MLRLTIPKEEVWNDEKEVFAMLPEVEVALEHSLLSLSKWESEYQKPFLSGAPKTAQEIFGYLKFMVISPDVDPNVLNRCSKAEIEKIQAYIDSPQSATTFGMMPERRGPGETITSELIYYWMVGFNIPWEAETWHLNRLFALIRICNIKQQKPKRMSRNEIAQRNRALNEQRRKQLGTSG